MPVAWSSWQVWLTSFARKPPRKNPEMVKEVLNIFKKEGILVDFWWILINMYLQNLNMMPIPTCKKGPTQPHPKRWFSRGNPVISGKSRLVKYYDLARTVILSWYIMVYVSFRKCKGLQPHERLVKMSFLFISLGFLGASVSDTGPKMYRFWGGSPGNSSTWKTR